MSLAPQTHSNGHAPGSSPIPRSAPPGSLVGAPANRLAGPGQQAVPQMDLLGALVRRKFFVILFALLGALLGYLHYSKTPPTYASEARLMIWEQAPPKMVEGQWLERNVSLAKHENLIGSELVLNMAIRDGNLGTTNTFSGSPFPLSELRDMLQIKELSESGDTLVLGCTGPDPEDLPVIINHIVQAYERVLAQDSKSIGQESVALIEKVQKRLLGEKETAEEKFLELARQLGSYTASEGKIENPYLKQLADLERERATNVDQFKEVVARLRSVRELQNKGDSNLKQLIVLDARKYLELDLEAEDLIDVGPTQSQDLQKHIDQWNDMIMQLTLKRESSNPGVGTNHPSVVGINSQIRYLQNGVRKMKQQLVELSSSQSPDRAAEARAAFESEQDAYLIKLYESALIHHNKRLSEAVETIDNQIESVKKDATKVASSVVELNLLRDRIDEKRQATQIIFDRLSEIDILSSDYNSVRVRLIDKPVIGKKIEPTLPKSIGIGTFLAGLLGFGLALLVDRTDMSFRTSREISDNLGMPVVAKIPRIRTRPKGEFKGAADLATAHSPRSAAAESFRAARTSLLFAAEGMKKVFLFTSPAPGDGKSTITSNLAISIAQTGKKVCLVDADFRRPTIHKIFQTVMDDGILGILRGECTIDEALELSMQDNLHVLTAGGRTESPGEVVTSPEFVAMIEKLKDQFDFVLIDSPPVVPVADASVMSKLVDGVYLILRIRKGVKVSSTNAIESLALANATIEGIIVNDVDENPHYSDYGYQYYPSSYAYYGRYYEANDRESRAEARALIK